MRGRGFMATILMAAAVLTAARYVKATDDRPLPDGKRFLREALAKLRSDRSLLSHYTFIETTREKHFNRAGETVRDEERVYEVFPAKDGEMTYRRLVSRDGEPVGEVELRKQDQAAERKLARHHERRADEQRRNPEQHAERQAEALQREEETIARLSEIFEFKMIRREAIEGHEAILVTFVPRPGTKLRTREGKALAKFRGRAWISETDHELIRLEAELTDTLSFGLGILARMHRGATAVLQRRRVNDEIWLPARTRFTGTGRLFLVKGLRLDVESVYSDYRKYTVETATEIESLVEEGDATSGERP